MSKVALCLPGGGATAAMYQIGALAALEDGLDGFASHGFDIYVATASSATVAATLAGGQPVQRMYRALLDPADIYFPLERRDILRMDFSEWRRTLVTAFGALRHGTQSLFSRSRPAPPPSALWEELERLYDSLPAGFFSLDAYERFLEEFFVRRGVPTVFNQMPKALRILAHDLDSAEEVQFGGPGFENLSVSRACVASMAMPPLFSPVRIGDRQYFNANAAEVSHLDVAIREGADIVVLVNPMVPVTAAAFPTGHGERPSVRDKGALWVASQANRIAIHTLLWESVSRVRADGIAEVIVVEPEPTDSVLFMYNPTSFAARRTILEHAYRTTRGRLAEWLGPGEAAFRRVGWRPKTQE